MKEIKKKNEMPLKHETFKGTFTDYRGMSRDFTMVAVSIPVKDDELVVQRIDQVVNIEPENECRQVFTYDMDYSKVDSVPIVTQASTYEVEDVFRKISSVRKMLAIGVAVRCNRDKDLGLGEYIAYGKALRNAKSGTGHVMFVSHSGMINTKMVRALLEQEAEHFIKDPGSYIKGYNIDRDRYFKTGHIAMAELTNEEFNTRTNKNIHMGKSDVEPIIPQNPVSFDKSNILNETAFNTSREIIDNADKNNSSEGDIYGNVLANNPMLSDIDPNIEPGNNETEKPKYKSRVDLLRGIKK